MKGRVNGRKKNGEEESSKMASQVTALAAQAGNPNLMPGTKDMEGENQLSEVVL